MKMADMVTKEQLVNASLDAKSLEEVISGGVNQEVITRLSAQYPTLANAINQVLKSGGKAFNTLAEANADISNLGVDQSVYVLFDSVNNGWYNKKNLGDLTLTKSQYDPVEQSNLHTDSAVGASKAETLKTISISMNDFKFNMNNKDLSPLIVGKNGGVALAWSNSQKKIIGLGLQESDFYKAYANIAGSEIWVGSGDLIPLLVGQNGGIALAWSKSQKKIIGLSEDGEQVLSVYNLNQVIFYGQSLSRGYLGTPVLSLATKQNNLTLTGGSHPTALTSLVSLFENDSESPCSGAANYAAYLAKKENSIDDQIVASTAGVNDALLSALSKGTSAYSNMLAQAQAVQNLKGTQTHAVQAVCWLQGESNLRDAIALETYAADLKTHFENIQNDVIDITNQSFKPKIIHYQLSTRISLSDVVCKAQLDLCKQKLTAISTPTYHLPYNADGVHLTNIGYKWIGAYFGRAYKQWVVDNKHPDYLEPLSAELVGNKIIVAFNVPQAPLVFDTTDLAATQDHGFSVKSNAALLAIANIEIKENTVEITLSNTPTISNLSVRYGLDYMAESKYIRDGKSGNLRDSTTDTVEINNIKRPLFHICPHFELQVISGEI